MNKKNVFIGLIATLVLLAGFGVSKSFAAQNNANNNGFEMMRNFDSDDFQKMGQAHNLMAQGNYSEARKIMQDLGMSSNCPMLNGNAGNNTGNSDNNGNFGGMMGGNGRGMMGNF